MTNPAGHKQYAHYLEVHFTKISAIRGYRFPTSFLQHGGQSSRGPIPFILLRTKQFGPILNLQQTA